MHLRTQVAKSVEHAVDR